jgi:quinoprotein glucose dehydrogenase
LRHAGVMGLAGSGNIADWRRAARDSSAAVRTGVLLALRRVGAPEIAEFVNDPDPRLVLEAARAINDVPITAAMPALATLPVTANTPLPLARRILNANFRLGGAGNAAAMAEAASRSDVSSSARAMALRLLADWAKPSGRDAIMGLWRPISPRPSQAAADALRPKLAAILASSSEYVRDAAVPAIAALGIKDASPRLAELATDRQQSDNTRSLALKALDQLADSRRIDAAQRALILPGSRSRTEALRVLAKVDPAAAMAPIRDRLEHGSPAEQQGAIAVLAAMPGDPARQTLSGWLDRLIAGQVPPELQLDLIEAVAAKRNAPELRNKLQQYEKSKPKGDPLAPYREVLAGGDAQRGMSIFTSKAAVECLRCHKVKGPTGEVTGGEVGPELSGIGVRQNRTYLLESILDPNKQIAQGFESVVLATSDGKIVTGVFRGEDDKNVRLITAEGKPLVVPKDSIDERKRGASAMPADLAPKLSKTELRDLIEFLASLKTPPKTP